jgi:hypothetical protein
MNYRFTYSDELYHHGVKGMKWGIRRYQNEDGSYTKAGRKRYALDLDVNDTSRRNVAKIRTGEAKRRLDVAKANKNKPNNDFRIAELQGRVRSAKRNERNVASIDRGAKLAAKGKTISGSKRTALILSIGATKGYNALYKHLNNRLEDLNDAGVLRPGHYQAAKMLNTIGAVGYYAATAGYGVKAYRDQRDMRNFNTSKWAGTSTIKSVGSTEYKDRKEAAKRK